jgi:hypothetical protein
MELSARLSKSLPFRDKSVKTLQYASRFLLGVYCGNLKPRSKALLQTLIGQCSQGRKVFRLLKSVNALQSIVAKSGAVFDDNEEVLKLLGIESGECDTAVGLKQLAKHFEMLELVFIAVYFGFDNVLFLGRSTIIPREIYGPQAKKWEKATFGVWLLNDLSCFVKLVLRISAANVEIHSARRAILDRGGSDSGKDSGDEVEEEYTLLHALYTVRSGLLTQLFKNLCDMGVSSGNLMLSSKGTATETWLSRNTPVVRLLANDTSIGLLGVLSSLTDISTMLR